MLVARLCLTLCDPVDCSPLGSSVHGILQAGVLGVSRQSLLQRTFPTQGSNPGLLHCRWILHQLSHQEVLVNVSDLFLIDFSDKNGKNEITKR